MSSCWLAWRLVIRRIDAVGRLPQCLAVSAALENLGFELGRRCLFEVEQLYLVLPSLPSIRKEFLLWGVSSRIDTSQADARRRELTLVLLAFSLTLVLIPEGISPIATPELSQ